MNDDGPRYYGKYRGVVTKTDDPNKIGRIQVSLETFPGWKDNWCMPCVPYAGKNVGWFFIPEIGAQVWIEFEGGNPDRAIWTGCFWAAGEIPPDATPSRKTLRTPTCTVVLDDLDGKAGTLEINATTREGETVTFTMTKDGIALKAKSAKITMDIDGGITVEYPKSKLELTASQTEATVASTSFALTGQDATLRSTSVTVDATNQLALSASSSTSMRSGQFSLNASTITLAGAAINIG
jgi:uncharacterized protein involved in type VI secretion and phage assembly